MAKAKLTSVDSFVTHYVQCMLWSTSDNSNEQGGDPLEDNYSINDLAPETLAWVEKDCKEFLELAESTVPHLLDDYGIPEIAHDFWLTRCGHGGGFGDGDYSEPATTLLTNLSKEYGNLEPYVGDDELLYLSIPWEGL